MTKVFEIIALGLRGSRLGLAMFWAFWALALLPIGLAAQNNKTPELEQAIEKIHAHYNKYEKKVKESPNKGAETMKTNLALIWGAAQRYSLNKESAANVLEKIDKFLPEAENFKTDDAKAAVADVKTLKKILGGGSTATTDEAEPAADNNAQTAPAEAAETEPNLSPEENDTAMNRNRQRTETNGVSMNTILLLFGVYILAIVIIFIIISNAQKRMTALFEGKINDLQKRLDARQDVDNSSDLYKEVVQKELKTKMDQLESNFVDYLRQFDARLTVIEKKAKNPASDESTQILVQNQEAQQNRLGHLDAKTARLEERLNLIEADLKIAENRASIIAPKPEAKLPLAELEKELNIAPKPAPNQIAVKAPNEPVALQAFDRESFELMIAVIEKMGGQTQIPLLEDYCDAILPALRQALKANDAAPVDLKMLAQLLQTAYVSALNENTRILYETLVQSAESLNLQTLEHLEEKPILPDDYAESLTFDQYTGTPRVRSEEFPNYISVKHQIETGDLLYDPRAVNINLFVLKPAIVYNPHENPRVLARGLNIVKRG